jgi:hypothetical protein
LWQNSNGVKNPVCVCNLPRHRATTKNIKPTETQDGLYIQKTNASGVIVGRGLIYDSTINPPANPIITADLNMNDYNILNTDNLYVATLNGNGTSYITMDADLYFYGDNKTIHDLNILYTNQIASNGSTIRVGADLIASGVNITGLGQLGTDSLSNGYSSNGILLGTDIKGNGQTIANVGAFSTATIGASTKSIALTCFISAKVLAVNCSAAIELKSGFALPSLIMVFETLELFKEIRMDFSAGWLFNKVETVSAEIIKMEIKVSAGQV